METLTIRIKKKSEVPLVKKILKALNVEIEEECKEITNPELVKLLKEIEENKNNPEYFEKNFISVDPNNLWGSLGLK